jgi:hypothetical protein
MVLQIINADPKYSPVNLVEPATLGYTHLAAEVSPPSRPGPIIFKDQEKRELVTRLKEVTPQLEELDAVKKVTIFEAVAIPSLSRLPYIKERVESIRLARFDIVTLIETESPASARAAQATPAYQALMDVLESKAKRLHVMAGRNAKRVGDVDQTRQGLFLFNYFVADDVDVMMQLWDYYLADWYQVETGLDNSTLLVPLEGEKSDYLAINHARWDDSLLQFMWRQLSNKSFRSYVLANLEANRVGAMPILYRLA